MKNTSDPSVHRAREQQLVEHVVQLLGDSRLRIDTVNGNRAVSSMKHTTPNRFDRGTDVKRVMSEMNVPDRDLQKRMPLGEQMEVTFWQRKMMILKKVVGRMRVMCVSPTRALVAGETPRPMTTQEITKAMTELPPALGGVPTTVVLLSTAGFTLEAHEAAARRPDRTLVLVEPNDAGGWSVYGPPETKGLVDLFDPEGDQAKRERIHGLIDEMKVDLLTSGIATDKLAAKAQLPLQLIEGELKSYAKANPGLVAKRLDGRVVLFREGSLPQASSGGSKMPMWESIKSILSLNESPQRKIGRLSEERTKLQQQRDGLYELIEALEKKEVEVTANFAQAIPSAQQRIATEVAQLRSEIERRHQLLGTIDKKIGIVSSGIHQLEMARQVNPESIKELEEVAGNTEDLEEGLASLDSLEETADAVTAMGSFGPSQKVQDVLAELRAKTAPPPVAAEPSKAVEPPRVADAKPAAQRSPAPPAKQAEPRRSDPEPG